MRRSEMVELLQETFLRHMNCTEDCCGTDEKMYSNILRELEDAGMMPPKVIGKYDMVPTVTPTGNHDFSWIREWEPE